MSTDGLVVHSLGEASLYLMLVRCKACKGAVVPDLSGLAGSLPQVAAVPVVCRACGAERTVRFDLGQVDPAEVQAGFSGWAARAERGQAPPINPSGRPSRAIDLAGWLTLHQLLTAGARAKSEQARTAAERMPARQMHIQASQCLEEALKFYDIDNELPPEDAFFTAAARRQLRESPEMFLRSRVTSMRAQSTIGRG